MGDERFEGSWSSFRRGANPQQEILVIRLDGGTVKVKRNGGTDEVAAEVYTTIEPPFIKFSLPETNNQICVYFGYLIADFLITDTVGKIIIVGAIKGHFVIKDPTVSGTGILVSDDWTSTRPPGT